MKQKLPYPITGHINTKTFGRVPILGIKMMSDERERQLAAKSVKKWEEGRAHDTLGV